MCNKMSDVRLSNASPTVERVDARPPDSARPVRRVLFGTPDPEETRRQAEALQREAVEAFRERYNFDPVEDRPLSPGDYEWQEDADAPEYYRRPPRESRPPRGEAGEDCPERRTGARSAHTNGSRKRSAGCRSDDCTSKSAKVHSDEDDDEEQALGAGSQAEERASRSEEEEEEEVPCSTVPEH